MDRNIFFQIGLRYAGVRSNSRFLSFLSHIAIGGMIFSVALLIVVMSVMNGFDRELKLRILDLVPHISFYFDEHHGARDLSVAKEVLASNPAVTRIETFIEKEGLLKSGSASEPLMVMGMDDYQALSSYVDRATWTKWQHDPGGILISSHFSKKLNLRERDLAMAVFPVIAHEKTNMYFHGFHVSGIFNTGTELDKNFALVHLEALRSILHLSHPQGFRVSTNDLFGANVLAWQLIPLLPEGVRYQDWSQTHGGLYEAVQMSRAMVNLLMFIIIAIAVFNVVSTLMLVVMERKQSIAILRVMGASRQGIMGVFLTQGLMIGLSGALTGALLGVVISLVLPSGISFLETIFGIQLLSTDVYPVNYIPADLRFGQVVMVVAVSVIFSVLASLYPAWKGAGTDPVRVLRYE